MWAGNCCFPDPSCSQEPSRCQSLIFFFGSKGGIFFPAALDSSVRNVIRSQEEFPRLSEAPAAERSSAGLKMGDAADDRGMRRTFIVPAIKSFDHYDFTRAKISCSLTWLVAKAFGSGRWRLLLQSKINGKLGWGNHLTNASVTSLVALMSLDLMIPSEVLCVCQAADVNAAPSFTFTLI